MNASGKMSIKVEHVCFIKFLGLKLFVEVISHPGSDRSVEAIAGQVRGLHQGETATGYREHRLSNVGGVPNHAFIARFRRCQRGAIVESDLNPAVRPFLYLLRPEGLRFSQGMIRGKLTAVRKLDHLTLRPGEFRETENYGCNKNYKH